MEFVYYLFPVQLNGLLIRALRRTERSLGNGTDLVQLIEGFVFGGDVLRLGLHQIMFVVETALVLDPVLLVRDLVTGHEFLWEPHKESRESLEMTKEGTS